MLRNVLKIVDRKGLAHISTGGVSPSSINIGESLGVSCNYFLKVKWKISLNSFENNQLHLAKELYTI